MAGLAAGESPWRSVLLFKMSQVRCVESVVGPKSADVTTVCYLAKFRPAHMYIPLYISARLHVYVCVSVWWNAGQRPGMTYAVCYWNFARMWKASRWKLRNASREWLLLIIYLNAAVRVCEWVMWFSVNRRRKWFFCSYLTSKSVARQPRISIYMCVCGRHF